MHLFHILIIILVITVPYITYLSIKQKIDRYKTEYRLTSELVDTVKRGGSSREDSFAFT